MSSCKDSISLIVLANHGPGISVITKVRWGYRSKTPAKIMCHRFRPLIIGYSNALMAGMAGPL